MAGHRRGGVIALVPWLLEPALHEWPTGREGWQPYRWRDPARVPDALAPVLDQLAAAADAWWEADQLPGARVGR